MVSSFEDHDSTESLAAGNLSSDSPNASVQNGVIVLERIRGNAESRSSLSSKESAIYHRLTESDPTDDQKTILLALLGSLKNEVPAGTADEPFSEANSEPTLPTFAHRPNAFGRPVRRINQSLNQEQARTQLDARLTSLASNGGDHLVAELLNIVWEIGSWQDDFFVRMPLRIPIPEGQIVDTTFIRRVNLLKEIKGNNGLDQLRMLDNFLSPSSLDFLEIANDFADEVFEEADQKLNFIKGILEVDLSGNMAIVDFATLRQLDIAKLSPKNALRVKALQRFARVTDKSFLTFCLLDPQYQAPLEDGKPFSVNALDAFIQRATQLQGAAKTSEAQRSETELDVFFHSEFAPTVLHTFCEEHPDYEWKLLLLLTSATDGQDLRALLTDNTFGEDFILQIIKSDIDLNFLKAICASPQLIKVSPASQDALDALLALKPEYQSHAQRLVRESATTLIDVGDYTRRVSNIVAVLQTASPEIQKYESEILFTLYKSDSASEQLQSTITVLESNLPDVMKVYKLFELLYLNRNAYTGKTQLSTMINSSFTGSSGTSISPVLMHSGERRRLSIIYNDLLKIHLEAANPSLLSYFEFAEQAELNITAIESGAQISNSNSDSIRLFLRQTGYLLAETGFSVAIPESGSVLELLSAFKKNILVKDGQRITDRLVEIFFGGLGITTLKEITSYMHEKRKNADQRNRAAYYRDTQANQSFNVKQGDLLKGINFDYVGSIFHSGNTAPQYIGFFQNDVTGDVTPFDTDTSEVLAEDISESPKTAIAASMAKDYAVGTGFPEKEGLIVVLKDRGQFHRSEDGITKNQTGKLEIFHSSRTEELERHVGVRTGFPPTEIDAFIALPALVKDKARFQALLLLTALNDIYIPIVDQDGKYLFTPDQFDSLQLKHKEIRDCFRNGVTGQNLLTALKSSQAMGDFLDMKLILKSHEDLTLEEHTLDVIRQYKRYFEGQNKQDLLDDDQMMALLTLHDIGKTLSQSMTGEGKQQHEFTRLIIDRVMKDCGWNFQTISIILETSGQDILGKMIQDEITVDAASRQIHATAVKLGVAPDRLLDLWTIYYQCDASSYTTDAGNLPSLDNRFDIQRDNDLQTGKLSFSSSTQHKVDALRSALTAKKQAA